MTATAYHFFYAHAGYSWNPKTETPAQGRARCAKASAYAERCARDAGVVFGWNLDPDITSADWVPDGHDGGRDCNPWPTWRCVGYTADGTVFASLSGVDFGRDGSPWGSPYRRVVEAELACELPWVEE